MRTALDHYGGMPYRTYFLLCEVTHFMDQFPDAPKDIEPNGLWSCHAVVRVLHRVFELEARGWKVVDGYFVNNVRHSWLYHEAGRSKFVLDAYPVASLGKPIVVDVTPLSPWNKLYIPVQYNMHRLAQIEQEADALFSAVKQ